MSHPISLFTFDLSTMIGNRQMKCRDVNVPNTSIRLNFKSQLCFKLISGIGFGMILHFLIFSSVYSIKPSKMLGIFIEG